MILTFATFRSSGAFREDDYARPSLFFGWQTRKINEITNMIGHMI